MRKISRGLFVYKKLFTPAWFILCLFALLSATLFRATGQEVQVASIIMPVFLGVVGCFLLKSMVFDLIEEVYDEGDAILFRRNGKEARVRLADVKKIDYERRFSPHRVTISVRYETNMGNSLSFSPAESFFWREEDLDVQELINRVNRANQAL